MTNKPSGLDGTAAMGHAWCGGLPYQHYYSLSSGLQGTAGSTADIGLKQPQPLDTDTVVMRRDPATASVDLSVIEGPLHQAWHCHTTTSQCSLCSGNHPRL